MSKTIEATKIHLYLYQSSAVISYDGEGAAFVPDTVYKKHMTDDPTYWKKPSDQNKIALMWACIQTVLNLK